MTIDNYSTTDIHRVISNYDKCIGYYTRLWEQASTRPEIEYWDGVITGLKRAKYLLLHYKHKEWFSSMLIYKEDKNK